MRLCKQVPTKPVATVSQGKPELHFVDLPAEIHEAIADHIFGKRVPTGPGRDASQTWNKDLRHPRRKALSALSLICRTWRVIVQRRIYRHSKFHLTRDPTIK
jgi:hypothetical protein